MIKTYIKKKLQNHKRIITDFYTRGVRDLPQVLETMIDCYKNGGKFLIMGNGGSAADAQHMAAELVGRLNRERGAVAAITITTDSSVLTAVGNDYGYKHVFKRQLQALVKPFDMVFALSTSGNSENVVEAARWLKDEYGDYVTLVSLTGGLGGKLKRLSKFNFNVFLAKNSSEAQEVHISFIHTLIDLFDNLV